MRFWLREIAGWLLVALGLLVFYGSYEMLAARRPAESGGLTVIGIFLFRGGIHLLKMAVAAQICLQAQARVAEDMNPKPARQRGPRPLSRFSAGAAPQTNRTPRTF